MLNIQPIYKTFSSLPGLTDIIVEWEWKDLSNEKIKAPVMAKYSPSPKRTWMNNSKIRVRFKGSCLKLDRITFTPRNVVWAMN